MISDKQINDTFNWCVHLLGQWAKALGMTYNAINVWIFCILEPLFIIAMFMVIMLLLRKNRRLKRRIKSLTSQTA
jgi:hypothetical protein